MIEILDNLEEIYYSVKINILMQTFYINILLYMSSLKPCPEGKERNPKTGRCITIN